MINSGNHLYILDTTQLNNNELFSLWYDKMPEYRKKKIDAFRFMKDKKLSLGAGVLLYKCFEQVGISEPEIVYNKYDKPALAGNASVHFNLSHSGQIAVCAVSDQPVGADVEVKQHFEEHLVEQIYSQDEIQYVTSHFSDPDDGYTLIWTVKESIMKYLGTGLSLVPENIKVDLERPIKAVCSEHHIDDLHFSNYRLDGYSVTVCSEYENFTDSPEWVQL